MSLLLLFLPRGASGVPDVSYARYLLSGMRIPRPVSMQREFLFLKKDMLALDGKTARDYTSVKERFILRYERVDQDVAERIFDLIELGESITFQILENSLTVASTLVWAEVTNKEYMWAGGWVNFDLELLEVS